MSEGTFSNGSVWASPSSDPIADLKVLADLIRRPGRKQPELMVMPGFEIVEVLAKHLPYTAPKLERERFSGGVNLSAQARNAAREARAREDQENQILYMRATGQLFCSPKNAARVRAMVPETNTRPVELLPLRYETPHSFVTEQVRDMPALDLASGAAKRVQARVFNIIDKSIFPTLQVF